MAGKVRWSSFAKAWPIANNLLLLLLSAHPLFVDCFASLLMASHWRPILGLSPLSKTSFSYSLSLSFCHYCHICSLIWVTLTDFTIRWCPVLRLTFHHVAVSVQQDQLSKLHTPCYSTSFADASMSSSSFEQMSRLPEFICMYNSTIAAT